MKLPEAMVTESHRKIRVPRGPVPVLYCHSTSYIGGGNKVLLELLRKIDRSRYRPMSLLPEHGPIEDDLKRLEVSWKVLNLSPHVGNPGGKLFRIMKLASHCMQNRIGLMHVNDPTTYRLASVGAGWAQVPVLCHVHHPSESTESLKWAFVRRPEVVVTPSEFMARCVREMLPAEPGIPVESVWNQVDSEWFRPADNVGELRASLGMDPSGDHICTIGAIAAHKGHECLLAAIPPVLEKRPRSFFHIVGSTLTGNRDYADRLQQLTVSLGIQRNVRFWGFVTDEVARNIVSASDLAVLPSREEGFCLAAAEAQACAVPVLASAIPPFDEVVQDGRTGVLLPCGDSTAFANGMLQLLESAGARARMGEAARDWVVRNFSCERYAERIVRIYDGVLNRERIQQISEQAVPNSAPVRCSKAMNANAQMQRALGFHQFLVSSELGGAGLIGLDIAGQLRDDGFDSRVWIPGIGPASAEASRRGLTVGIYDAGAASSPVKLKAGMENFRLARHLRKRRRGIVHLHSPQVYGCLRRGLRYSGLKRVAHVHLEDDIEGLRWAFRDPPDAIVTCARFLTKLVWQAIPPELHDIVRVAAVPNAVDLDRFSPGDRTAAKLELGAKPHIPLLLMMANLAPHKGQATAIRAVGLLKARGIQVQCWLAGCEREPGQGHERYLRDLAIQLNVGDDVRFLGFRSDGPKLMQAADLVLLPSAREGLPLSILEAQASRVPVLAAPVAGVPEVISHEKTGLLIGSEDAAGYAEWIARLLATPVLYEQLAEQAYQRVRRENTVARYMEQIRTLYQELIESPN